MLGTILGSEVKSVHKSYEIFDFMETYILIGKAKKKMMK